MYVERSDVFGASDNAIDFVAVQHGHLLANRIHHAADWCAYAKGGSADILVSGNEIYGCGTGDFSAGQGTGLQFMTPPWLNYEAYDMEVTDNFVHDTEGAGLGVNGGNRILLAHNTLYRVGRRSHTLEVVFGARSCDGRPGDQGRERCRSHIEAGAWGTTAVDDGDNYVRIPNRDVWVLNNLIFNPRGHPGAGQLFTIFGSYDSATQRASSGPSPARADDGLQIRGNSRSTDAAGRRSGSAAPAPVAVTPTPPATPPGCAPRTCSIAAAPASPMPPAAISARRPRPPGPRGSRFLAARIR